MSKRRSIWSIAYDLSATMRDVGNWALEDLNDELDEWLLLGEPEEEQTNDE